MATPFTFEAPADGIAVSGEVSLALDKTGNPRIAFSQKGSGQIIVAQRNSGTWTHENVPGGFVVDDSPVWLAIDSVGNPQVGYRELNGSELIHAKKSGGQWSLAHIRTRLTPDHATGGIGTVHFSLHPGELDTESRDVAYFVYTDLATDDIGFAHTGNIGPTPVPVQVSSSSHDLTTFGHPSASFDPSENYFVGYIRFFETGSPQKDVAVRETHVVDIEQGTFSTPVVIEDSPFINVIRPTSIVRTFSDGCLAYFDSANKTVKASVTSLGVGGIETVATDIDNIVTPSAAANAGAFRIAFADFDAVKLASRSQSGTWTLEVVDPVFGGSPSLAYDNARTANIAYVTNGSLKYARRSE